jgi:hypothetical protein
MIRFGGFSDSSLEGDMSLFEENCLLPWSKRVDELEEALRKLGASGD